MKITEQAATERRELNDIDAIFGRDEKFYEIAELNRKATALGDSGQLDDALACLIKVRDLEGMYGEFPAMGIRYPLYLQRAGHGLEAKREMMRLLEKVPQAALKYQVNGKPAKTSDQDHFEAEQFAVLYDKLRLIFKREKEIVASEACLTVALAWRARASAYRDRIHLKKRIAIPKRPEIFKFQLEEPAAI